MRALRKRRRRAAGLTLVEVMLAAVVVGAGLALVAGALSQSIRAESHAEQLVRISRLLDLQLGRIEGGVLTLESATGDFTQDGEPDVTWTITVEQTETANLQQITLEAAWTESNQPQTMDLVRLLYQDPDATTGTQGQ